MNDYRSQFNATTATGTRAGEMDEGLRSYMLGVYNYMALGVAGTGAVSFAVASNQQLATALAVGPLKWVLFAAIMGLGWFAPKVIFSGSKMMAHGMFWAYAAAWGALIAPMLLFFQQSGAAIEIYRAFFITAAVFGSMSLIGYTTKRDLSGMANFFFMAVLGLLLLIVVNMFFFQSPIMSLLTSGAVVLVFSGITAYETQMIKSLYQQGSDTNERASIFGAFALYGSFITLFIHILNILGIMGGDD